jgi:uncharacterized protein YndB with AHSA1/START domain
MKTEDFSTTFLADQSPKEVFDAVNNVRGWWSERIDGNTDQINEEFKYQRKEVHKCTMKIIELVPNKRVVWRVLYNYFDFTKDENEWTGTTVEFDISEKDNKTQLRFTHHGLVPAYECYNICFDAWTFYITDSLRNLIVTGKGKPNPLVED